jgi:hypothetical protein
LAIVRTHPKTKEHALRDIKEERGWNGDDNWPTVGHVFVPGDETAQPLTSEGGVATIQSWHRVAVLQVSPPDTPICIGFKSGSTMQFLSHACIFAYGRWGMRVGDGDVEFTAIATNLTTPVSLTLVTVTTDDDREYAELDLI